MYLFTRAGQFAPGSMREALGFARAVTEKVRQETGTEFHPWISSMSPSFGTVVWATFVEDLPHLEETNDKLATSEMYMDLVEGGGRLLVGPPSDGLAKVVSGEPDMSEPLPNYLLTARATAANGRLGAAFTNGIELAEAVTRITGVRCTFLADVTGPYGGCRWASGFQTVGELERAQTTLTADPTWLELIDRIGPSYRPDASQMILRRLD